jgi:hypothetical protein
MMKNKNIFIAKFTVVAVMLGLFSPSLQLEKKDSETQLNITVFQKAEARRSDNRGTRNRNVNRKRNVNRHKKVHRKKHRNVNRRRNVNYYHGGHHRHQRHYGYYRGNPVLRYATAMAIGSIIASSTMPTTCTTIYTRGATYRRCGNAYYSPFYSGDSLVYRVVDSPYY